MAVDSRKPLIFSLVAGIVSATSGVVQRGQSAAFPFGRDSLVPLAIGAQAMVRIGVITFAVLEAIATIGDSGDPVDGLPGVVA